MKLSMKNEIPVIIDQTKCIKCLECTRTCPTSTLYEKNGIVRVTKDAFIRCVRCAHCLGVCPEDAITVSIYSDESEKIPISDYNIDPENLMNFMRSRRSIRIFKPDPIEKSDLERLINAARFAPSAHNDQSSEFTVITGERVKELRNVIIEEVSKMLRLIPENEEDRVKVIEKMVPKNMVTTIISMIEPMKEIFTDIKNGGRDRLFWGAPALIIITANKKFKVNTMVIENASLTAAYLMLMAEAMNLGTCSLGLLMFAIYNSRKVAKLAGIPKENKARYALAVGKKDTNFKYLVPRKKLKINFVE